jgi:sulfate adenylyltransferase subunit 1
VSINDIVRVRLSLQAPLFVDAYDEVRATGSLILIDEATNHTVAAGLVQ